jgi:putative peptidoglycan lipid II flippase
MSLGRAAVTVSAFTLLSRITGLLRDIMIARTFGASALTDAFWVAFRIPNLLRRLFAEGAFSQAFVPILSQIKNTESATRTQQVIDRVAVLLFLTLTLITIVGVIGAPFVVMAMASGLTESSRANEYHAAVVMTQIMFPYIICMSMVSLASGVLNTYKRFAVPAFTPVLLNLSMIAASFGLGSYFNQPIYALAVGVVIGGLLQLVTQWLALYRLGVHPRLTSSVKTSVQDATVKRVMKQMVPATLGVSVAQLSLLINTNIATWLAAGSVTWLSFADRLMEFPTALIGVALGTVLLPSLSKAHAQSADAHYSHLLDWGLRLVFLFGVPAAIIMVMLSNALVATLFNYGAFTAYDVAQTQTAVMAYSVGLIGLLAVKILAPGFYGKQNIRTPVKIAIFVLVATQFLNLIFVPWLAHAGLALSIGLGACINALALLVGLKKRAIYKPEPGWYAFFARQLLAVIVMAGVLFYLRALVPWTSDDLNIGLRVFWLGSFILVGLFCYLLTLFITGQRLKDFKRAPAPKV